MQEVRDDGTPPDQAFLDQVGLSRADLEAVIASGTFDREFYLATYPDIGASGVDPLEHYLVAGRYEKRQPNALFDPVEYLELNAELQGGDMEPFQHYALIGHRAGLPGSRADVICRILASDGCLDSRAESVR